MKVPGLWRAAVLSLLALSGQQGAQAGDIYGYVDERGVAHFASEVVDARYRLFFRGGQAFDTGNGLGRAAGADGPAPAAAQKLLALFQKSARYSEAKVALQAAAQRHAIDYALLQALVATESGFDAAAVSPKGAIGLMQLMPDTARRYGVKDDAHRSLAAKLADPKINVAAGARHLRDLIERFPGQLELALAAYNAGEGAVQRAGQKIPPYRETQNYVRTVLQLYDWLQPAAQPPRALASTQPNANAKAMPAARNGAAQLPARIRMEMRVPQGTALARAGAVDGAAPATE